MASSFCIRNPAAFPLKFLHSLVERSLLTPSAAKQIRNEWVEENKPPAPLLSELEDSSITVRDDFSYQGPVLKSKLLGDD
jgi:hypothetical protein